MNQNDEKIFIYCVRGYGYLAMLYCSLVSLLTFSGAENCIILVSKPDEKRLVDSWGFEFCRCLVVPVSLNGYNKISYKLFALAAFFEMDDAECLDGASGVVVSDVDILWKSSFKQLSSRLGNNVWFHKITVIDPLSIDSASPTNGAATTLRTLYRYSKPSIYTGFIVNAGLYQMPPSLLKATVSDWLSRLTRLPSDETPLSEAILSQILAEKGIEAYCDSEDIKFVGIQKTRPKSISVFEASPLIRAPSLLSGYQTAKHYHGSQRKAFVFDVLMNLRVPWPIIFLLIRHVVHSDYERLERRLKRFIHDFRKSR